MKPNELPMKRYRWLLPAVLILLTGLITVSFVLLNSQGQNEFNGERAYQDVLTQVAFGPRTPGSTAHQQAVDWMVTKLKQNGWLVEVQELEYQGQPVRNVIAKKGSGDPWIILGAHYDSRLVADQDSNSELSLRPVPGANDGASGVGVLMEISRVLP
ncbi:M28 family peptidase, partial [bacterium]